MLKELYLTGYIDFAYLFACFLSVVLFLVLATRSKGARRLLALLFLLISLAATTHFYSNRTTPLKAHLRDHLSDSAVIETKKIVVSGYHPINPSIVPYEEGYLLSFRTKIIPLSFSNIKRNLKAGKVLKGRNGQMWVVKLNSKMEAVSKPTALKLNSYSDDLFNTAEDGRLIQLADETFIFYNDYRQAPNALDKQTTYQHAMYVAKLTSDKGEIKVVSKPILLNYNKMSLTEKNWTPFVYEGSFYLIPSSSPHAILKLDLETGNCAEVAVEPNCFSWKWGTIRGGTPALLMDGSFLTFFHSMQLVEVPGVKIKRRNYAMGAYLFENGPPFTITKMSPSPLSSLDDYGIENRRKVVFPGGLVISDNQIHVVWGKNDKSSYVTTFDKEKLFESMVSCSQNR